MIEKAKRNKKLWTIVLLVLGASFFCCCGVILARQGASPDGTPAAIAPAEEVTVMPTPSRTSVPTAVPTTIPTATPLWKTVADIERERAALTDLQRDAYDQAVLGEVIKFEGQVIEVHSDGDVQIDDGQRFGTVVILHGIPQEIAIGLDKDQLVSGMGLVVECSSFLGLHLEIEVTSLD